MSVFQSMTTTKQEVASELKKEKPVMPFSLWLLLASYKMLYMYNYVAIQSIFVQCSNVKKASSCSLHCFYM